MKLEDLQNKKIGIIGFGVEGKAVAEYLEANNLEYTIFDKNEDLVVPETFHPSAIVTGDQYLDSIETVEILFRSPGVSLEITQIKNARNNGVILTSQMKYFFDNCPTKNTIGITGTKGKSTASNLLHNIFIKAGKSSVLAGNFGAPVLPLLNTLQSDDLVVLELSSFQLEDMQVSPHIAVVLMVTSEHLDYHPNEAAYVAAKATITKYQSNEDIAVININYPNSVHIGNLSKGKHLAIKTVSNTDTKPNEAELFVQMQNGFYASEKEQKAYIITNGQKEFFFDLDIVHIRGFHMLQNIGAAVLAALAVGIAKEHIIQAISEYSGLPHRLEYVDTRNGVTFINDSISTTVESTIAAMQAFTEPIVLILGGSTKNGDYKELVSKLTQYTQLKAVIIIGELSAELTQYFNESGFKGHIDTGAQTMTQIFEAIKKIASPGDVVLLSPAMASFGLFKNYKDRGDQFKELAHSY